MSDAKTYSKPSLNALGESPRDQQMDGLFQVLDEISRLQAEEHKAEIERIRAKQPSDHKNTIYFYDQNQAPHGYVKMEGVTTSLYMLRRYAMKVKRNVGRPLYVYPYITQVFNKDYLNYIIYSPVPGGMSTIIPITRRRS